MTRPSACLTLVVTVLLTACGGGSDGGSSSDSASTSPASGRKAAPVRGGTLTVAAAQGIPQLNPAIHTFAWEEALFPLLWNGLSKIGEDGRVVPDLATRWSSSSDHRRWTFELRDGLRYSDGKPLTASSVVAAFRYYLDPKTATQEASKLASIADVSADGAARVRIRLKTANALLPAAITNVKIIDVARLKSINEAPPVTGPFRVKEFVPDDHITLERNPSHVGEPAPLDAIKVVKAPDATSAYSSLRSADIDVLWSVPQANVPQIERDPQLSIVRPKIPSQFVNWDLDTTSAPFDKLDARRALAYATDRQAILNAAYYKQGVVSDTNTPLAPQNPAFGGRLTKYAYDLDKAKALFAKAGVKAGDKLTWWGVAGQYPEWNTTGEILQGSLKKIGIALKIENHEISSWAPRFYPPGKRFGGLIVPNFQSVSPEPAFSLNYLFSSRCNCNWTSKEFTRLFAKAQATASAPARDAIWEQIQALISDQVPVIIPLQATVATATRKTVAGAWVEGGGQLHLERAGLTEKPAAGGGGGTY